MSFIEQLRKSKEFRAKVILVGVIILLIYGNTGTEKKEARIFNENSGCAGLFESTCKATGASEGYLCVLEYRALIGGGPNQCVNCVRDGYYAESDEFCCSGFVLSGTTKEEGGQTIYLCRAQTSEDVVCTTKERGIAKIIQGMGLFKGDCKTAYYMAIFGSGIVLFMMMSFM